MSRNPSRVANTQKCRTVKKRVVMKGKGVAICQPMWNRAVKTITMMTTLIY